MRFPSTNPHGTAGSRIRWLPSTAANARPPSPSSLLRSRQASKQAARNPPATPLDTIQAWGTGCTSGRWRRCVDGYSGCVCVDAKGVGRSTPMLTRSIAEHACQPPSSTHITPCCPLTLATRTPHVSKQMQAERQRLLAAAKAAAEVSAPPRPLPNQVTPATQLAANPYRPLIPILNQSTRACRCRRRRRPWGARRSRRPSRPGT